MPATASTNAAAAAASAQQQKETAERVAAVLSKGSSHAELQRVRGAVEDALEAERKQADALARGGQHGPQGPPLTVLQARLEVRFGG